MRLTIDSVGSGETLIDRKLTRFAANVAVPTAALGIAAEFLRSNAEQQFDTEGGHGSGGWKPLAESTILQKERLGLQPEILRATDDLMNSLIDRSDSQHTERRLSADSLAFGTRVPYAIYHATGTVNMPERPPIQLTDIERVALVKAIQRSLIDQSATQSILAGASSIQTFAGMFK